MNELTPTHTVHTDLHKHTCAHIQLASGSTYTHLKADSASQFFGGGRGVFTNLVISFQHRDTERRFLYLNLSVYLIPRFNYVFTSAVFTFGKKTTAHH